MTGEELIHRPDLEPCDLVDGVVVPLALASWKEGAIKARLGTKLWTWADSSGRGEVFLGNTGIYIRHNPDTVRAADVIYVSHERYARQGTSEYLDVVPELIAEVVAPDDLWDELVAKLGDYFSIGIDRVWVLDSKQRRISVYRSLTGIQQFQGGDILTDEELLPGFSLAIADLFA